MKKSKATRNSNAVVVAEPVVVEPLPVFEECESKDAAERVRFHLSHARVAGRVALAHIIEAGRELAIQKQLLGYGQWSNWCDGNLDITQRTADKYIETFQRTIGVQRIAQGVSLDKKILKKELEAATIGMEEKTVRQAMIEIGVIKSHASWGGKRDGAGRKAKDAAADEAAALDEVANSPALLIAAIREPISTVYKAWRERDVFAKIDMSDLALVTASLQELATAATAALKARSKK